MSKKFMYICSGIFMLALAWHLGAKSAVAQAVGQYACVEVGTNPGGGPYTTFSCVIGRTFYRSGNPIADPIPGSEAVIACTGGDCCHMAVALANGDVYEYIGSLGPWQLIGNLADVATPVQGSTMGQLKTRFDNRRVVGKGASK